MLNGLLQDENDKILNMQWNNDQATLHSTFYSYIGENCQL